MAALPAASPAVTVTCVEPAGRTSPLMVQLVVPEAMPLAPWLVTQVTWATPTLSDAVPPRLKLELDVLKVGPEVGEVMLMVGGVVSGGV